MKRLSYLLSALSVGAAAALAALPAAAAPTSSGLSITPRKNYTVAAGQTVTDKLSVSNLSTTADLAINLKMIDFTYSDQSGIPKLLLAANAPRTPWSLKPFTILPKAVVIPAGQTKAVDYSISIPAGQNAGSYYGAIEYQATGASGSNVSLNASGVTLVFVSVPGPVKESMTIQKFGAYQTDKAGVSGSFVFVATTAPKQLAFTIKNESTVAESPAGNIVLHDMFGHKVTTINNANPASSLALLGQSRLFTTCIRTVSQQVTLQGQPIKTSTCADPRLKPGRYTASLDILYGQNGNQTKEITATASFWYLPWWFILTVAILVLLIVGIVWWLLRRIRRVTRASDDQPGPAKAK